MPRFYCPYCTPQQRLYKQIDEGGMVCGYCGDKLVKERIFQPLKLVAMLTAIGLVAPLFLATYKIIEREIRPSVDSLNAEEIAFTQL